MSSRSRVIALVRSVSLQPWCAALLLAGVTTPALASRMDIGGPPGSHRFGYQVLALPNGNFAVSDPYTEDWSATAGFVYLYDAKGVLISTLTGSDPGDGVGQQLRSLGNGNFVVLSPDWNHGRGAVTFVNGTTGLSGTVSADNSLVGSQTGDYVGNSYIESWWEPPPVESFWVLGGSNFVVVSNHWSDGSTAHVGAVTWCSGTTGCTGPVSSANSLIGGTTDDLIGTNGITELSNGNYVVVSRGWDNPGVAQDVGAATLASGNGATTGVVSPANSLVGSHANDMISAYVTPLHNGNYVVGISSWDNGALIDAGAAVWGNGTSGVVGSISSSNAFVGSHNQDYVGLSVTALSNGHYVVCSPYVDVGPTADMGAANWGNGDTGLTGSSSGFLALIGPASGKGPGRVVALSNGNYVVVSPGWDAGGAPKLGAVTWVNGSGIVWGSVSAANSLVGSSANDDVGTSVVALSNGNYVVGSPNWDGVAENTGAVTWANGGTGLVGPVSAGNSLVGSTTNDGVGGYNILALKNGNYVVTSVGWDNGNVLDAGAATWGNGATGIVGAVSAANSLVGAAEFDRVGNNGAVALSNGNYVVGSYTVDLAGFDDTGAVTWGNGTTGIVGTISINNSLYGTGSNQHIGSGGITAMSDGNYLVRTNSSTLGALTLATGTAPFAGAISPANTVFNPGNPWSWMSQDYDAVHHRLVIGYQDSNLVSVFTLDADTVFADGFDGP